MKVKIKNDGTILYCDAIEYIDNNYLPIEVENATGFKALTIITSNNEQYYKFDIFSCLGKSLPNKEPEAEIINEKLITKEQILELFENFNNKIENNNFLELYIQNTINLLEYLIQEKILSFSEIYQLFKKYNIEIKEDILNELFK